MQVLWPASTQVLSAHNALGRTWPYFTISPDSRRPWPFCWPGIAEGRGLIVAVTARVSGLWLQLNRGILAQSWKCMWAGLEWHSNQVHISMLP